MRGSGMKISWETINVDNSPMRLYLCQPENTGLVPAIVVIQNQDGLAEFTQEMTRRVAEATEENSSGAMRPQ
jgi:dienelactone hydrolase